MIKFFRNKKPLFYSCSAVLVVVLFLAGLTIAGKSKEKKKQQYIGNPQAGDVYLVKENRKDAGYYFLKVAELWEDSIIVYHSSFEYNHAVNELDKDDYFVLDEQLIFTKNQLQEMLDNNEISMVERDYGSNESFNRMKY